MKCLILAMLLVIVQAGSPVPRQTSQNPANNRTRNTQSSQKDKTQAPTPPPIQSKEHTGSAKGDGNNEAPKHEQEHVIVERLPDKDLWERAYIIFTGALALIGLLTLGAVVYQAVQTARATVAMAANTDLQKAALRQWVTIEGFRDSVEPRFTNTPPHLDLHFSFEIANRTKMPLTLKWYVISINQTKYSSRLNFTLAPDQIHGLKALIEYTREVQDKYTRGTYEIIITGTVAYNDVFKESQTQRFGYVRKCGPTGGETLNFQGPLPDEDIEKEESKT